MVELQSNKSILQKSEYPFVCQSTSAEQIEPFEDNTINSSCFVETVRYSVVYQLKFVFKWSSCNYSNVLSSSPSSKLIYKNMIFMCC